MIHRAGLLVVYALLVGCGGTQKQEYPQVQSSDTLSVLEGSMTVAADTIPPYAQKVIVAYPDFDIRYSNNKLLFPDGASIVCDDGRDKSFTEKLDDCDIEDMFSMTYDVHAAIPAYLSDCGRGRCEELFKKMYGSCEAMVRENLVPVTWFGQNVPFTKVNGAAEQLGKVASELDNHPDLEKYLTNASSFYWRKVRGANRQSAHSYGIAIDINTAYANYWLWTYPTRSETDEIGYENRIPMEIVEIFEKHGFVWGGRWYHYDTMHFEYRPELLK